MILMNKIFIYFNHSKNRKINYILKVNIKKQWILYNIMYKFVCIVQMHKLNGMENKII